MKTKIAILLGAGSSVAAGFPCTRELTELVLSGHGVTRHGDGSYYYDKDKLPPMVLQFVTSMVRRLNAEAERYYSAYAERPTNYEDIYYLARQASDQLSREMENPAIRVFVNELKADMSPLVTHANEQNEDFNEPNEQHVPNNLKDLLNGHGGSHLTAPKA